MAEPPCDAERHELRAHAERLALYIGLVVATGAAIRFAFEEASTDSINRAFGPTYS
ncbi:hypothetical protein SAMN05444064_12380 [Pseudomonas syringae]|nr:hypothetical protein SAMN05444514_1244 [Pseudomonas syringae]SFM62885.1 hypothetical protein SAMN05444064_12380 [Pseudomonas syringae]